MGIILLLIIILLSEGIMLVYIVFQYKKTLDRKLREYNRTKYQAMILADWLKKIYNGKNLSEWLLEEKVKEVAVYGMGKLGMLLCDELLANNIEVSYAIDQRGKGNYRSIPIYSLDKTIKEVDMVIVTSFLPNFEMNEGVIDKMKLKCPVISIERLLYKY